MINFECDYTQGTLPEILSALCDTNMQQTLTYGEDEYSAEARELIRKFFGCPQASVHFMTGGTQANRLAISWLLRPHQGVIAAETGHISVHETGAIEASGHKVLTLPSADGKITARQVADVCDACFNDVNREHIVCPGMVYISQPTENGTLYSRSELTALSEVCREKGVKLYMDGARLSYALASPYCDLTAEDCARLCDVICMGGTKAGALFGEALVFTDPRDAADIRCYIKQSGALLAKGRLLGLQFAVLMRDGLYIRAAKRAVTEALRIRKALEDKGIEMYYDSYTNQQFPVMPDEWLEKLSRDYLTSFWFKADETHSVVRFCTSWATEPEQTDRLLKDIAAL